MNYVEQINRFNRFTERVTRLSGGAQLLWFKLMDMANSAYWPDWVQVGTKTLMELMSVESEKTFHKFRKELVDNGLIEIERGKRGKLPRYHLNQLDERLNILGVNITGNKYRENELEVNFTSSKGSSKGCNQYPNRYPNQGGNNAENQFPSLENNIYINKNKNKDQTISDSTYVESLSSDEDSPGRIDWNGLVDFWNDHCGAMPKITCVRGKRLTAVKARIREFSEHDVRVAILKAGKSDFLNGANKNSWMASFDWILKPSNFAKVLEGNYDNRGGAAKKSGLRAQNVSEERLEALREAEDSLLERFKTNGGYS